MKILAEIYRFKGIKLRGKMKTREAARAIVRRGGKVLMVYSANVGDYKFPGGGVEAGERHAQTLARELREECGATLLNAQSEMGAVIEYDFPTEERFDVFKMTSHYYFCSIEDELGAQTLDEYENMGFTPVWIGVEEALAANRALLGQSSPPVWLRREILALESL